MDGYSLVKYLQDSYSLPEDTKEVVTKEVVTSQELQSYISPEEVTNLLFEYRNTVKHLYDWDVTPGGLGHGPAHSFIGWLIKEGKLNV